MGTISVSALFLFLLSFQETRLIEVCFKDMSLIVKNEKGETLCKYPIAAPMITPPLPVKGKVREINLGVAWYPTLGTRAAYLKTKGKELPERVPFGSPLNALGAGVIRIDFESKKINPLVMIHGTNDPKSIGQRITRGCIRLRNEGLLKLVEIIKGIDAVVVFK